MYSLGCPALALIPLIIIRPLQSSGDKLPPEQIAKWLGDRGLYWACFCGVTAPLGVHFPCQFILSVSGDILAYCYHRPSVCKFFSVYFDSTSSLWDVLTITLIVNLSTACKTTNLVSPYASIHPA